MKRIRKLCRTMLTMVAVIICLMLMVAGIILLYYRIPIPKDYKLEDVEDDKAVMVAYFYDYGEKLCAAVTKSGRWKCADLTDAFRKDNSRPEREQKGFLGVIDAMMEDEEIPYQDTKLFISKMLLRKTINMPQIDREYMMECHYSKDLGCFPLGTYYLCYVVTGTGEERDFVRIAGTTWRTYPDLYVLLAAHKIKKLEHMRQAAMGKP